MACELALFRSRTCYRCAFICSFSKFSGHRKSHASSNKTTLHAWLFLAYDLSHISLSLSLYHFLPLSPHKSSSRFSAHKSCVSCPSPRPWYNFWYGNYSAYYYPPTSPDRSILILFICRWYLCIAVGIFRGPMNGHVEP